MYRPTCITEAVKLEAEAVNKQIIIIILSVEKGNNFYIFFLFLLARNAGWHVQCMKRDRKLIN